MPKFVAARRQLLEACHRNMVKLKQELPEDTDWEQLLEKWPAYTGRKHLRASGSVAINSAAALWKTARQQVTSTKKTAFRQWVQEALAPLPAADLSFAV